MTLPDFTSPNTIDDPAGVDPLRRLRRPPRRRLDVVLAALLVAVLAAGGFLAGFVVAVTVVDPPPCTRTVTQLPREPDDPGRAYGSNSAVSVACDVDSPADVSPWTAERGNG